jgi:hypothetical protein
MYESPIELITTEFTRQINKQTDEAICQAVQSIGVNVNKNELIKALQYDRDQYDKGYKDGIEDGMKRFAEIIKEEMSSWTYDFWYYRDQREALSRIDELIKERFGDMND